MDYDHNDGNFSLSFSLSLSFAFLFFVVLFITKREIRCFEAVLESTKASNRMKRYWFIIPFKAVTLSLLIVTIITAVMT